MLKYHLSQHSSQSEFLKVRIEIDQPLNINSNLQLKLSAWRPGRYQLGNFARNIRNFHAINQEGNEVAFHKLSRNVWQLETAIAYPVIISYEYYTSEIDGGSTYVDEEQWYLNFINCLMYLDEKLDQPCEVHLNIPIEWRIACGLKQKGQILSAPSFYDLVDSPAIASPSLKELSYSIKDIQFHLWFQGDVSLRKQEQILNDFSKFTEEQVTMMPEFEGDSYHFLYQVPDQKAYHGVEHLNSTCIVLGPARDFNTDEFYDNLLGISSHELFHYWNIIRIRPKEMFPYDFSKENYFSTGYVAEGVTTYYGDLFLIRSGVKNLDWYKSELNKLLKRHFDNYGRHHLSVADSSLDLWVDGYEPGIPDRKVSIYVKGAIIALILDLRIIKKTKGTKSLDDVMRILWTDYYKESKGYSPDDYLTTAENVIEEGLDQYRIDFIEGTVPVEHALNEILPDFGFELVEKKSENLLARFFGFKLLENAEKANVVNRIAPGSPGELVLRRGDQLISINNQEFAQFNLNKLNTLNSCSLQVIRNGILKEVNVAKNEEEDYFTFFEVNGLNNFSKQQLGLRNKWLKC